MRNLTPGVSFFDDDGWCAGVGGSTLKGFRAPGSVLEVF